MKQPEEFDMGDQWDLVYHRLQIAEEDYETAELLMQGERYRGANNRAYYGITMQYQLCMRWMVMRIKDIKMLWRISIRIM